MGGVREIWKVWLQFGSKCLEFGQDWLIICRSQYKMKMQIFCSKLLSKYSKKLPLKVQTYKAFSCLRGFYLPFNRTWEYSWGEFRPLQEPSALPLDLICVHIHARVLLPVSEGSFVPQFRIREVNLLFPRVQPLSDMDRQPPKDSISWASSYLVPGIGMGKRFTPAELPAKLALVLPAQNGDSCHQVLSRDDTGGAPRLIFLHPYPGPL